MVLALRGEGAINNNNVYEGNKKVGIENKKEAPLEGQFPDIFVRESLLEKVTFKLIPEV